MVREIQLLADAGTRIEVGGTRNAAAFDAHRRGLQVMHANHQAADMLGAIATYDDAIWLDPGFALAYANRSMTRTSYTSETMSGPEMRRGFEESQADAQRAIELAPDLAEGHVALAFMLETGTSDFAHATREYDRARALAPATVLRFSGLFSALIGDFSKGINRCIGRWR